MTPWEEFCKTRPTRLVYAVHADGLECIGVASVIREGGQLIWREMVTQEGAYGRVKQEHASRDGNPLWIDYEERVQ